MSKPTQILILTLLSITIYANAQGKNVSPKDWNEACLELKKTHLSSDGLNITFTKREKNINYSNFWILKWNTIDVPIPPIEYQEVFIDKDQNNDINLILMGNNKSIFIFLSTFKNEIVEDIFATSKIGNNEVNTLKEGKEATNRIFGRQMRFSDLTIMGYETTPASLTCENKNQIRESGIAIALILKGIARPGNLVSVHKGVGSYSGWLEVGNNSDNYRYVAHVLPKSKLNLMYQIIYRISKESKFNYLPYSLGSNVLSNKEEPGWLAALNNALEKNTKNSWEKYITFAKEANIGSKSISKLENDFKINNRP